MTKIPEAESRLFKNVFICRACKTAVRATSMQVISGKVKCRKCNRKALRPKKKK